MSWKTQISSETLHFLRPATTSRGSYSERKIWLIKIFRTDKPYLLAGIGECSPLPDLSYDDVPNYEEHLQEACSFFETSGQINYQKLRDFPSILFGLETAQKHFEAQSLAFWDTSFSQGKTGIPINGLIWMAKKEEMLQQIEQKLNLGFHCIKVKIGAIDFTDELSLLSEIRKQFSKEQVTLRVDANGAFTYREALNKLHALAEYDIHSIEQPIPSGQWGHLAKITQCSPVPVALDEELIGVTSLKEKQLLLDIIMPQYIVLKPSLHGGFSGSEEWIKEADKRNIGWWITSALESNIGLNAIAQWTATLGTPLHQGLGTGQLFTNNIATPLEIRNESLWFVSQKDNHVRI